MQNASARKRDPQDMPTEAYKKLRMQRVNVAFPARYRECMILHFQGEIEPRSLNQAIYDFEQVIIGQHLVPTVFILDMIGMRLTTDVPVMRIVNMEKVLLKPHLQIVIGASSIVAAYSKLIINMARTNVEFAPNLNEALILAQSRASETA